MAPLKSSRGRRLGRREVTTVRGGTPAGEIVLNMFLNRLLALTCLAGSLLLPARVRADAAADYAAGVAAYSAQDYQTAVAKAEAAVAADPKNWQAWQLDGNARYALGDKAGAVTVYKYALQMNPDNPQLKSFVDSLEAPAAPVAPAKPAVSPGEAVYQSALAHYKAGDQDTAMKECAEAVRADPRHWQAWSLLGNIRYARNDKRGALHAFDNSLAVNPNNPDVQSFRDGLAKQVAAMPPDQISAVEPAAESARKPEKTEPLTGPRFTLDAGIALMSLAEVKDEYLKSDADDLITAGAFGESASAELSVPRTQIEIGLTTAIPIAPEYGVAVRMFYDLPTDLTNKEVFGFGSSTTTDLETVTFSSFGGTVGGYLELADPSGFSYGGSVGLGYLHLGVDDLYESTFDNSAFNLHTHSKDLLPLSGGTFVARIEVGGAIALNESLAVTLDAGYRLAKVAKVTVPKDTDTDGDGKVDVKAGAIMKNSKGDPLPADLSGLAVRLGLRLSF